MPRFTKGFSRRKSSNNVLEYIPSAEATESSFRVFERFDDGRDKSFDGGVKLTRIARPSSSPLHRDDNIFEHPGQVTRANGASNANTLSTNDDSSRLSATSTAASSLDNGHDGPSQLREGPAREVSLPPIPKSISAFSLRAAGRTFSFGRAKAHTPPPTRTVPSTPIVRSSTSNDLTQLRQRAVTTSSYASTATPPDLDDKDLSLNLGGDFSSMFTDFGNRTSGAGASSSFGGMLGAKSAIAETTFDEARFDSTAAEPPPLGSSRANPAAAQASGRGLERSAEADADLRAETKHVNYPPARHVVVGSRRSNAAADNGLRRSSALAVRRQSTLEYDDCEDEDAKLLRDSVVAVRHYTDPQQARDSCLLPSQISTGGQILTPSRRAGREHQDEATADGDDEEEIFDAQIMSSANLAEAYQQKPASPIDMRNSRSKVLTPAQYESYRNEQDKLRGPLDNVQNDDDDADDYDDDEDEMEKHRELVRQRRKQEAHMAVYRQQMMKVTGEVVPPAAAMRPSMVTSQSTPNLSSMQKFDEDDEDDEVPLGILAAHGFPNKNRGPSRLPNTGSNTNIMLTTQNPFHFPPSADADTSRLPVFARSLPQDPYLGAGLINATNRESLSYGTSAAMLDGTPRAMPSAGLVGVIATEERSRALRRGSPGTQGEYLSNANGHGGIDGRSNQDFHVHATTPGFAHGTMNTMAPAMTSSDEAQVAMLQQMQQFMSMQMQLLNTLNIGGASHAGGANINAISMNGAAKPSPGFHSRPTSMRGEQRPMSTLEINSVPWQSNNAAGTHSQPPTLHVPGDVYASSIAPSERSNIGQPGRYRPVSHMPADRTSETLTTLRGPENWHSHTTDKRDTISAVPSRSANGEDDDDDAAGWELMRAKREQKRNMWKLKKAGAGP